MSTVDKNTQEEEKGVTRQPVTWEGREYVHTEKGTDWYWALGLIAVAGSVAALNFHNILFAIFILIAAFVLALFASRKSELVTFSISQRGVRINETLYSFQSLESFGIDDMHQGHIPQLILKQKKHFILNITIPLENANVNEVHDFLHTYLRQEDLRDPFIHKFMEWLGF